MTSSRPVSPSGPSPWPDSARWDEGELRIAGIGAVELAETFGTPVYVIDEGHVRARCAAFRDAFDTVLYAAKALTTRRLIRVVADEGLGVLAASGGEVRVALDAGVAPEVIALHGNNKDDEELRLAVRSGIGLVICDNAEEVERLASIANGGGTEQAILLRVLPSISAGAHPSIETGGENSRFGMTPGETLAALRRAQALAGVDPVGLHLHLGSQVDRVEPMLSAVDVLVDVAARAATETGARLRRFDVGGGFPATYVDEVSPDVAGIARDVIGRLRTGLEGHGLPMGEVIVEPGRSIVANAGVTLYRVGVVKERGGRVLAAVDGGMSDNIRPALYGARYSAALASPAPDRPTRTVDVVGKHCESGDVIARERLLPEPRPGDLLAVAATGAYCYSLANNYNQAGRSPVVAVRDGVATQWLRREGPQDLRSLEADEPPGALGFRATDRGSVPAPAS